MSDAGVCAFCNGPISENADTILYHVLLNHPTEQRFRDFIDTVRVPVECVECGGCFQSTVSTGHTTFSASAHCSACRDALGELGGRVRKRLSVRELVENGTTVGGSGE